MAERLKLPVGIEDFQEIREEGFYYIDKTQLIEQLLDQWGKVNLFTRPRRFGKTLNMSMLRYFFEIGTDKTLFDGLYISENKKICQDYMGKFPVIFISLKDVDGLDFEEARRRLTEVIGREAERLHFLLSSDQLTENDKNRYRSLIRLYDGQYAMNIGNLTSSLKVLSELLYKHYNQKAIFLIDEYDVPLDKAFAHGYYGEMVSLMRGMFGQALKTNDFLQMAVLTGCLRISKESIFTGLNNFKVLSITDPRFDEQFGFTEKEVEKLLEDYQLSDHLQETKDWYDGYHFGDADVFCPWDVINHADRLLNEPDAEPQAYWINTSGNDLVKRFIERADRTTQNEIERLVDGEAIEKSIRLELTYDEIDNRIDNLWSVLFATGYLTQDGKAERGVYRLKIPNEEIREVYRYQIKEWFSQTTLKDIDELKIFWKNFEDGSAEKVEKQLTKMLNQTISFLDTKGPDEEKEKYYHAFLLGLLIGNGHWMIKSNREAGDGFADIIVETEDIDSGIVIELKYARTFSGLAKACESAMTQIHERRYDDYLRNDGRENILAYGIAFCKKRCKVVAEHMS